MHCKAVLRPFSPRNCGERIKERGAKISVIVFVELLNYCLPNGFRSFAAILPACLNARSQPSFLR
jgi:hypothetical protein